MYNRSMEFKTNLHTIYFMVGPSNCGKSYLSNILKSKFNQKLKGSCEVLSSDQLRREILGEDLNKYNPIMNTVSKEAFTLLTERLEDYTSNPTKEFIIVDSTGLSPDFLNEVKDLSKRKRYNLELILFDYDNETDFFNPNGNDRVTKKHLKWFKRYKETLKKSQKFKDKKIISNKIKDISLEVKDLSLYKDCLLSDDFEYIIFGDTHGCYEDFINFLKKEDLYSNGKVKLKNNQKLISVGDIIDKGPDSKKLAEFIVNNKESILVTNANHENLVYKLKNNLVNSSQFKDEFLKNFFDTYFSLDKKLINDLYAIQKPFFKNKYFVVTHAPCKDKYLGKIDGRSKTKQRNLYRNKDGKRFSELDFLHESNLKIKHFWGHISFKDINIVNNSIGIDTGCFAGNKLSYVKIHKDIASFHSIDSVLEKSEELYNLDKK